MDAPKVTIIIINWNGKHFLEACLSSIAKNTTYPNYELALVDNGSSDGSVEFLERNYPGIKLIKNNSNLGFARACNQAIIATESDYVFLLNNDTEVVEGWLTNAVTLAESDPQIGIVGAKVYYMDAGYPQYCGDRLIPRDRLLTRVLLAIEKKRDRIKETDFVSGAGFLVKKELFDRIGPFDENFYLYCEESDFCCRARSAGYKVMYTPHSQIRHKAGGTGGHSSYYGYFHQKRSQVRFYLLNFSIARLLLQVFLEIPVILDSLSARWRIPLLLKAYRENLRDIEEIWHKRRKRGTYTFRSHSLFKIP